MQNKVGKNIRKLYITTAIVSFLLVLTISLTLILALGARSTGGSGNNTGNSTGTIGTVSTEVYNGSTKLSSALSADANTAYDITVKNTSTMPVYIRARVINTNASTTGEMFTFDSKWTYAVDNYLYYSDIVAVNDSTTTLFGTAKIAGTYRFIVEALQQESAVPNVAITVGGATVSKSGNETLGTASCELIQHGLIKYQLTLSDLNSSTNTTATKTVTIQNNGKQDLNVKFRINSSEWMVQSAQVSADKNKFEWYPNAGYYEFDDKFAIGETLTITLADANKNNGVTAGATTLDLTLQDYIVAKDIYSLVDSTTLQNVGTKVKVGVNKYTVSYTDMANLAVYSYNNINKLVYVKVSGGTYTYDSAWGVFEGEATGVSGTYIAPKSCSAKLFDKYDSSGKYTIEILTAQTISTPTVKVISSTSLNGSTNYYQPATITETPTQKTTTELVLDAGTKYTTTNITDKWANLAVYSDDSSDMLVRVALSFTWGTLNGNDWTQNNDALGFNPSVFYGDGFSFNSEDQSLTYNYNLSKGKATSALLDFDSTAARTTELATMVDAINAKNQALKLTVMVEAIYALGSQLDILKIDGGQTTKSGNYYTTDELGTEGTALGDDVDYISMTQAGEIICGDVSSSKNATAFVNTLSKYVVYVTNNFPVGVRIAVALQWGTYSNGVWTSATTTAGANSTTNLDSYLYYTSSAGDVWAFDADLGGYNYKCSVPGKCATLPIFATDLSALATALNTEYTSRSDTTNKYVRVVIMAETTHKV